MVRNFRRSGQEPDLSLMSQGEDAYLVLRGVFHVSPPALGGLSIDGKLTLKLVAARTLRSLGSTRNHQDQQVSTHMTPGRFQPVVETCGRGSFAMDCLDDLAHQ
jgi:hypothetical protein